MSVWLPPAARGSVGAGVSRENEGEESARPRGRGGAAVTERTSAQRSIPPAGCPGPLERQHPPCRGGCGGSMSFWLPSRARWSRRSLGRLRGGRGSDDALVQHGFSYLGGAGDVGAAGVVDVAVLAATVEFTRSE